MEGAAGHLRFKCRIGHEYALNSLLEAKEEAIEQRLWSALVSMDELASLLEELQALGEPYTAGGAWTAATDRVTRLRASVLSARAIIERNAPIDRPRPECRPGAGNGIVVLNDDRRKRDVIVIGASAGGVPTLIQLFSRLQGLGEAQVAVVLHRSPVFEGRLGNVLGRRSALPVVEPEDGTVWEPGRIYVAPRDRHMVVDTGGVIRLNRDAKQHHTRPAVDPLFISVARVYGPRAVGLLLTGMGDDGVSGLIAISVVKGVTLVQSPAEAPHPSMPRNAIARAHVEAVLPVPEMPVVLASLAEGSPVELSAPAHA